MPDGSETTPTETTHVKTRTVSCDGGEGAYGHPKVYLRITGTRIACPYCSRLFVLQGNGTDHGH